MTNLRPPIPAPDAIDPNWMTALLRNNGHDVTVTNLSRKRIGTGQVGENYRFILTYAEDAANAPVSLVGKFSASDPDSFASGVRYGLYRREVAFYQHIAPTAGLRVPRCYYANIDELAGHFVLMLEDLAPARQGDQLAGLPLAQIELALGEAAKLHASHWGDSRLDAYSWMQGSLSAPVSITPQRLVEAWNLFKARYRNQLDGDALLVGEAMLRNSTYLISRQATPQCLVHNDFRPDNMMFGTEEGGASLTIVDWQSAGVSGCMADVAYLLSGALPPAQRQRHEQALLRGYHEALCAAGVRDYPQSAMLKDYAFYTFRAFYFMVFIAVAVEQTKRGDEMFMRILKGSVAQILDNKALALLPA